MQEQPANVQGIEWERSHNQAETMRAGLLWRRMSGLSRILTSHTTALIQVPATLFFIQFSAHMSGKAVNDCLSIWVPSTQVGDQDEALEPRLQPGRGPHCCSHSGKETAGGRHLYLCWRRRKKRRRGRNFLKDVYTVAKSFLDPGILKLYTLSTFGNVQVY